MAAVDYPHISLAELLSACVHVADEAGNIIRDVFNSGKLTGADKGASAEYVYARLFNDGVWSGISVD